MGKLEEFNEEEIQELESLVNSISKDSNECIEDVGFGDGDSVDALGVYLKDISKYPLLSKEEEYRLAVLWRDKHDLQAREELINHNLRLVISVAKRYNHQSGLTLLDLIQEGSIGLMTAIDKYDPSKGYKLSTYAVWWIRQAVSRSILNTDNIIRLPVHVYEKINKCDKAITKFISVEGRQPKPSERVEILKKCGMSDEEYGRYKYSIDTASLDKPIGTAESNECETELMYYIADPNDSVEDLIVNSDLSERLIILLNELSPKEREVISLRFGLDGHGPRTLQQVGEVFNLTRERIRQIEGKAIRKLQVKCRRNGMRQLLTQ